MKKVIEKYEEKIRLYEGFMSDSKLFNLIGTYQKKIINMRLIIEGIKTDTLTPEFFDKLDSQDKWDISYGLNGKVDWFCGRCGGQMDSDPERTLGEIYCSGCDHQLTRRTGGGMSDPFEWKFKWNIKSIRKQKLEKIESNDKD